MTNFGLFKKTGTTVTFAGGYTEHGTYLSDPAAQIFSSLAVAVDGRVIGGVGDQFTVTGAFTNAGDIDLGGSSTMLVGNGAGTLMQTAGTLELGTSASLIAGTVAIDGGILTADGPGATIAGSLVYASSQASAYAGRLTGGGAALTVNGPAALLVLSGSSNSYGGGTFVTAGVLEVQSAGGIPDGGALTVGGGAGAFGAFGRGSIWYHRRFPNRVRYSCLRWRERFSCLGHVKQ